MTILLIDDSRPIRAILRLTLTRSGFTHVIESSGGREGVETARRQHPDLIVLDVLMPDMDGCRTLAALRADARTSDIPVVFLTGEESASEHARLRSLGARDVLVKPFDPTQIAERLQAAMAEV